MLTKKRTDGGELKRLYHMTELPVLFFSVHQMIMSKTDGHVRGRERYVSSICLVLTSTAELIIAIVIEFLFLFDKFHKLLQFSSYIQVRVFSKRLKSN